MNDLCFIHNVYLREVIARGQQLLIQPFPLKNLPQVSRKGVELEVSQKKRPNPLIEPAFHQAVTCEHFVTPILTIG